jgi:hypothetical protein
MSYPSSDDPYFYKDCECIFLVSLESNSFWGICQKCGKTHPFDMTGKPFEGPLKNSKTGLIGWHGYSGCTPTLEKGISGYCGEIGISGYPGYSGIPENYDFNDITK